MAFPIPVSVLTGFLGAGKTSLLNRLLRDARLADTAVIINEFGEVGIDHLLVERSGDGIIELADGCICCTVRGELVDTLAGLVDRVQTGALERLSRVIIETTGLADPVPVLQSIMGHPALVQAFRLDGVIALVDAIHGERTLDDHVEAVKQVAMADRIVLTKTDLVEDAGALAGLRARLADLNPRAGILDVRAGTTGPDLVSCGLYDPETKSVNARRWLGEDREGHHAHHGAGDHVHDAECHDGRFATISLRHERPIAYSSLEMFLDLLLSQYGDRLLRLKGIVELSDDGSRPLAIHAVQSLLHPPVLLPAWPDAERGARIVLVGLDLPADYVRRLFAAAVGQPVVDGPDRAALTDNPLSVPGYRR